MVHQMIAYGRRVIATSSRTEIVTIHSSVLITRLRCSVIPLKMKWYGKLGTFYFRPIFMFIYIKMTYWILSLFFRMMCECFSLKGDLELLTGVTYDDYFALVPDLWQPILAANLRWSYQSIFVFKFTMLKLTLFNCLYIFSSTFAVSSSRIIVI